MDNKFILLALFALIFGACNDDDETTNTLIKRKKMTVAASVKVVTKSGNTTENLKEIGVYVTPSDLTQPDYIYKNALLRKESSSGEWIPTTPTDNSMYTLYWCPTPGSTTALQAYAPYSEDMQSDTPFRFAVKSNQNDAKGENMAASDLLYCSKSGLQPTNGNYKVSVEFEHLCAKFVVTMDKVAELAGDSIVAVYLGGMVSSADFDLSDGNLTPNGTPSEIQMFYNPDTKNYECIIIPQAVEANALYISATLTDGRDYETIIQQAYTFEKGIQYGYDVTLGTGLTFARTIRAMAWNSVSEDLYME